MLIHLLNMVLDFFFSFFLIFDGCNCNRFLMFVIVLGPVDHLWVIFVVVSEFVFWVVVIVLYFFLWSIDFEALSNTFAMKLNLLRNVHSLSKTSFSWNFNLSNLSILKHNWIPLRMLFRIKVILGVDQQTTDVDERCANNVGAEEVFVFKSKNEKLNFINNWYHNFSCVFKVYGNGKAESFFEIHFLSCIFVHFTFMFCHGGCLRTIKSIFFSCWIPSWYW